MVGPKKKKKKTKWFKAGRFGECSDGGKNPKRLY